MKTRVSSLLSAGGGGGICANDRYAHAWWEWSEETGSESLG